MPLNQVKKLKVNKSTQKILVTSFLTQCPSSYSKSRTKYMHLTPNPNPKNSIKFFQNPEFLNKFRQISAAIKMKLPATNTKMYYFDNSFISVIARLIITPNKASRLTKPLQRTV